MAHKRTQHPGGRRLAVDPYRVEETTWTREEILRARGDWPTKVTRNRNHLRRSARVAA